MALLLFHGEHFYGFSESDYENVKKKSFILQQKYLYIARRVIDIFEVL